MPDQESDFGDNHLAEYFASMAKSPAWNNMITKLFAENAAQMGLDGLRTN